MLLLKLPNDSSVDMFKAKGFLSILLKTLAATVRASLHWTELLKKIPANPNFSFWWIEFHTSTFLLKCQDSIIQTNYTYLCRDSLVSTSVFWTDYNNKIDQLSVTLPEGYVVMTYM